MNNEELLEPTPPPQVDQGDTNDPLPQRLASLDIFDPGPQPPLEYVDDIFLSPSFSTSIEDPDNSFSTDWPQNNNLQFYQFPFQQYIPMYQPPSLDTQQHTPTPFSLSAEHAFDKCPFINTYLQRQRMESDNTLMPLADVSLDRLIELDSLLPLTPLQGIVDNKTFVQVAELPHYRPDNLQFPQPGSFYPQTPQDSESSTLIEEEQRLWDIIFSPMSPQIPQRTPSVKINRLIKDSSIREQEAFGSPNSFGPALSDHECSSEIKDQVRDQRGDKGRREGSSTRTNDTSEDKRPRKAIQLKEKLQIIQYSEKKPQSSFQEIAKHFHVPRTTVHGIIKNKAILQQLAESSPHPGLTLETSRMTKLHFSVLEELLMAWILDLESRCIPVSGHKITTQAFEIHRMLSGLLLKPLPPCQFSSGWLKNFKNRRQISRKMLSGNTTVGDTARAFKELHAKLDGFNMRSVYWCDVTNMFLGAMPTRTFQNGAQENHKSAMDTASASVLLCSNVVSYRDVKPLVMVRHGPGILEIDGYGDMVVDAGAEDLTTSVFKDWLTRFGRMRALPFKVALLVDEAVWRLLEVDPSESTYATGGVTVFKVPRELSALMPLSDGVAKELKANFHILLMEAKKAAISRPTGAATPASVTQINDISIEDHLKFIPEAWNRVPSVTLNHSFKRFLPSTPLLPLNDGDQQHVDSVPKLKRALEDAFPAFPDYILEYYLHHDRDVGPSSFLRAKIQEMQRHPDYENLFGTLSFGEVRDVSERLQFSSLNPHLESQNNLRLVHEKPENERPKVNSYYPEGVFFAKPYEFPGMKYDGRSNNSLHQLKAARSALSRRIQHLKTNRRGLT